MTPVIKVEQDYEGCFEGMVRSWIKLKEESGEEFLSEEIVITAGPWRPYAVTTKRKDKTLHIDFYSALRVGFGALSQSEVKEIIRCL